MKVKISWNEDSYETNVNETESELWKEVAKNLLQIPIPNQLLIETPRGDASLSIKKRGTYTVNGEKRPSMYVTVDYNQIAGLTPSTYPEAYLTCINFESNNYKFYWLKPRTYGIDATYGRIGSERGEAFGVKDLQNPYDTFLYWIRYYEKLSKGYTDQTDVYLSTETKKENKTQKTVVKSKNPVSAELYRLLKMYAKHVVEQHLKDSHITQAQVIKSRECLKTLGACRTVDEFNKVLMELLTISPRKARYITEFLAHTEKDFSDIIEREENLISAMEAMVDAPEETKSISEDFDAYGMEVYYATEKQKKQVLSHLSDQLKPKVKQIYRVIHKKQRQRFDDYLEKHHIKKVKQLWHGSRNENWFSIAVNGLQLNPNAIITGKMFGQGIYFAPSSMKSWNYTSFYGTSWANGNSDTGFMGLYATAYGKPYDVTSAGTYSQASLTRLGCNCVHAHAGSALRNDEIVFYDEASILLQYIVEFQ